MIVLKPIGTSQRIKFIPTRSGTVAKCVLTDEVTNVSVTYDVTATASSFYTYFDKIVVLEEGKFYTMELKTSSDTLVHRDKVFCTNQSVDTYSVNNGQYITNGQTIIFHD